MLCEFLADRRDRIIAQARFKVAGRAVPRATQAELQDGIPTLLTYLVELLQSDRAQMGTSVARHGEKLLGMAFSVAQVADDYGEICQAIVEIAGADEVTIGSAELATLGECLDAAIASACELGRQRELSVPDDGVKQLGFLAHELRNALGVATNAFEILKTGTVGMTGGTSLMLGRNLDRMRELIDRSLVDVRLKSGTHKRTRVSAAVIIGEVAIAGELDAQKRGLKLRVPPVGVGLTVDVDPHLLNSALTNLLQNAFKFTRPGGQVSLRTVATAERVRIEIEDECGGLPTRETDNLFRLFEQRGSDRSGLGLGLAISRQAVEASGGIIEVRDLPGRGCVFSIDLPREP